MASSAPRSPAFTRDQLGRLLGLRSTELNELLASISKRASRRGDPEATTYRWKDVQRGLGPEIISRLRAQARERLMAVRTSEDWVAGYPDLVRRWDTAKNGDTFPFEVGRCSRKVIWWKCSEGADHEWSSPAVDEVRRRRGCPFCSNHRLSTTNSLAALHPELAREWHPTKNAPLLPTGVIAATSHRRFWWKCPKGVDHEWIAFVANRMRGIGCPFCAGYTLSVTNSLATFALHLVREWHPTKNGKHTPETVLAGSTRKHWWRCDRGHEWRTEVRNRALRGSQCPVCTHNERIGWGSGRRIRPAPSTTIP
jgi:hypothetical protein